MGQRGYTINETKSKVKEHPKCIWGVRKISGETKPNLAENQQKNKSKRENKVLSGSRESVRGYQEKQEGRRNIEERQQKDFRE